MKNEINILIGDCTDADMKLFFQSTPEDLFHKLPITATWADIAVLVGLFPSRTQAMKNGYNLGIPDGFTDTYGSNPFRKNRTGIGKKNIRVTIFKESKSLNEQ